MWTRSLLKTNAKEALRGRYWRSFLLCLLLSFLGIGDVSTNVVVQVRENIDSLDRAINGEVWQGNVTAQDVLSELPTYLSPMILNFVGIAVVIGIIIVAFLACFLLLKFGYHIDEDLENQIVKELKERHEKDENKIEIDAKIPEVKMPNDLISK